MNKLKKEIIIVLGYAILLIITKPIDVYPTKLEGYVDKITKSYIVVKTSETKIIVYADEMLPLDTYISVNGDIEKINGRSSFYSFNFSDYLNNQGIYYCINNPIIHIIKQPNSLRGYLSKQILLINDLSLRKTLLKVFFNINSDDDMFDNVGFCLSGFIMLLSSFLRLFFKDKIINKLMLILMVLLCVFYHFSFISLRIMCSLIIRRMNTSSKNKWAIYTMSLLVINASKITSMAFWLPVGFRLISLNSQQQLIKRWYFSMLIQSIFMNQFNLVTTFFYKYLFKILGMTYIFGIFDLFFHSKLTIMVYTIINYLFSISTIFDIKGNCLGFGLILFAFINLMIRKREQFIYLSLAIFIFFSYFGLFHPLAEVTYINVGQGDSILVRLPFNQDNVLIDTGRPSQYRYLQAYLDAKGINTLNYLIITHQDDDHSGNKEQLCLDYKVNNLIEDHHQPIYFNGLSIYDLNDISNDEDENNNSIVNYFEINGLKFLMMGDASKMVEGVICQKYRLLECDVLKLGHHGSNTSNSDELLTTVRPKIAIVSSGLNNMYGHPSSETIQNLLGYHIPYLNTAYNGDITIISLLFCNLLITSNGIVGII